MYDVVTFGEAMIRLEPNGQYERLERANLLKTTLGGAEVNVSAALANIGKLSTAIVTKLPANPLGRWIEHNLSSFKVGTDLIVHGGLRVGTYYSEQGSRPRTTSVVYDRKHSSFAESTIDDYALDYANQAKVFHTTGITLALSDTTRAAAIEMIKSFHNNGTLVSFDVNYRANLWDESEARECIEEILPYVDILFISEETCRRMFARTGSLEEILRDFATTYDIQLIASTKRKVINQSQHQFSSLIYDMRNNVFHVSEAPYNIEVVDRIGSGDAYIAGVLYGLLRYHFDPKVAQEYGDAFSAMKCTIPGDFLIATESEITSIIEKHKKGITEDVNR